MRIDFDFLLEHARGVLDEQELSLLFQDRVEHHTLDWHVHGVLGHAYNVIDAAKKLRELTGIDVVEAAALHDIWKIVKFPAAIRRFKTGQDPAPAYYRHESASAHFAAEHLSEALCNAIRIHHWAYYGNSPEDIMDFMGDPDAVKVWMLLAAADGAGKGFPRRQTVQRPQVAGKFRIIGATLDWPEDDPIIVHCCHALTYWEPIAVPKFAL